MDWKKPLRPIAKGVRRRRIPTLSELRFQGQSKVNIGAGSVVLPGWVNTDLNGPVRLNLLEPWPVHPGSIDYVYGDNVIEHFTVADARVLLRHAFDALRPGGTIRLCTPDARKIARAYLEDGEALQTMLDRHRRVGYLVEHKVDALRIIFSESGHHIGYIFDEASLTEELRSAGFLRVRRCRINESQDPELRGLESRDSPADATYSMVLEADRP